MFRLSVFSKPSFGQRAKEALAAQAKVPDAVRAALTLAGLRMVATSKSKYLSGPRPRKLGVVSGRLRASIGSKVSEEGSDITLSLGTDVPYARRHEFGFKGLESVRGKRKTFTRRVDLQARPFLSPAIKDNFDFMKKTLIKRVMALAKGKA